MDEITIISQMITVLSSFEPDSQLARLAVEFAQRPAKGDGDSFWDNRLGLVTQVRKAISEFESHGSCSIADIEKTTEFVKKELSKDV